MYPRNVMKFLHKHGAITQVDHLNGNDDAETASKYRIQGYARVNDMVTLKKALLKNGVCLWAGPMYDKKSDKMWRRIDGVTPGGHAMAVVGYTKTGFILRNSFGKDWGDNGHCIFPYEDWGQHTEVWTCIDAESGEDVSCCTNSCGFFASLCSQ